MIFSEIEEAVLQGEVDCGVIIHESRFTFMNKGLVKLADLGDIWEIRTGCPIPLGGIVIQKKINDQIQLKVNRLIKKSVEYSFLNYPQLSEFVIAHSQEMEESVMRKHIDLYVNNYSISLGKDGEKAVKTFFDVYSQMNRGTQIPRLSLVG
jgi:1,4-dihydroxy-6-naphthoate synthase